MCIYIYIYVYYISYALYIAHVWPMGLPATCRMDSDGLFPRDGCYKATDCIVRDVGCSLL